MHVKVGKNDVLRMVGGVLWFQDCVEEGEGGSQLVESELLPWKWEQS